MTHRMSTALTALILLFGLLVTAPDQAAAQAPAAQAQALTYDLALKALDAAEAEARRNKWNVTIVVTDAAGIPVLLRRLDGASPRSYDIAMRKAATVVASRLATSAYGAQLKDGKVKEYRTALRSPAACPSCGAESSSERWRRAACGRIQDEHDGYPQAGANAIQ